MKHKIGLYTALSIVIANMVGTGVFTSLGFQLFGTSDIAAILSLWVIGGVVAILGSFAYSELGAAIPKSGGEYRFLSETFHPFLGFLSGWVSATIGFAAPIAAAAWALGKYLNTINPSLPAQWIGFIVIILITIVQSTNHQIGGGFQRYATSIKIGLILVFILVGAFATTQLDFSILPTAATWHDMMQPSFAVSLVYVSYAYSGWNASSYIAGEMYKPERNIPISILGGTLLVALLYIGLNFIFLKTAPLNEMRGVPEVAFVSAKYIFGAGGSKLVSLMISLLLVSTISSMIIVGPRVINAIGEDYPIFKIVSHKNKHGIPVVAIISQSAIASILLFSSTFDTIITYISFTLSLFSTLTVLGVFFHRKKYPDLARPYKTWGYPFTPAIYVAINCWFLYFVFTQKTAESLIGLGVVALGAIFWLVSHKRVNKPAV